MIWHVSKRIFLAAFLLLTVLAGCSSPTPEPIVVPTLRPQPTADVLPTLNAVRTQAVQTFVLNLTQTAPSATPVPPTKAPPTATATQPAAQTSATAAQAQQSQASATPTQKPLPAGPTATTAVYCSVKSVSPTEADTLTPRTTFTARWVVNNTGSQTWTAGEFALTYWSGARFEGQTKLQLPIAVGGGDNITLASSELKAPSTPGTYRAYWAVAKGFQPYCLMPLTIVVK